jgi:hypothetical protein
MVKPLTWARTNYSLVCDLVRTDYFHLSNMDQYLFYSLGIESDREHQLVEFIDYTMDIFDYESYI